MDVEALLKGLKALSDSGDIDQLKFEQTRKVKFDLNGAPLPTEQQDEPIHTKLSFRQPIKKAKGKA